MADKLGIGTDVRRLRLGSSFYKNGQAPSFHTIRYDFKPASVDTSKGATVEIRPGNEVAVVVPHIEGSGTTQTVFKGNRKNYLKECVLIIDPVTGDIALEKLSNNIQVKKTRAEGSSKIQPRPLTPVDASCRKLSPVEKDPPPQKSSLSSPVNTQRISPRLSPNQKSPGSSSIVQSGTWSSNAKDNSMPNLLSNDFEELPEAPPLDVGILSDSMSETSSSASSSTSDSDSENELVESNHTTVADCTSKFQHSSGSYANGPNNITQFSQLSEDLQLSESGSDSET